MMIIVNNKEIMEEYTNNRLQNTIGWTTTVILILLSAFLLFSGVGVG
jgi:Mn2+/Fe2+ NRAMP family transporter